MPKYLTQLRDAYCLTPPISTSTLRPPHLSRDVEAKRPRAPLKEVKREITGSSSVESVEFVLDKDFEVKPPKMELDPRQLRREIAALAIAPPPASPSSSTSGEASSKWSCMQIRVKINKSHSNNWNSEAGLTKETIIKEQYQSSVEFVKEWNYDE